MILLALVVDAHASACCVGTTTTLPTRLGRCESAAVGVTVGGLASGSRWDASGAVGPSSLTERSLTAELLGAWRWSRNGQLGVAVPGALRTLEGAGASELGYGVGDVRVGALFERDEGSMGYASTTVRVPTGRSFDASDMALGADVTGRSGVGLTLAGGVEQSEGLWPWNVQLTTTLDARAQGLQTTPMLSVSAGRSLGPALSVAGSVSHRESLTRSATGLHRSADTRVGALAVRGAQNRYRLWLGASSSVPLPILGADQAVEATVSGGYAKLF